MTLAAQIIDNAASAFGDQVERRHLGADDTLALLQARKPINAEMRLTDTYGDRLFAR